MKRVVGLLLAALLGGCSLPLPSGARTPSGVTGQQQPADLQVLPQGPMAGQPPTAAVAGFLAAQASPAGDYAIARQFLTGEAAKEWSPDAGIRVYQPDSEQVEYHAQDRSVQVSLTVTGRVDPGGHFVPGVEPQKPEFYGVQKTIDGWRVSSVPDGVGLHLSPIDLLRTFSARNVYYLATQLHPDDPRHLVPDRVFLPARGDVDTALVRRLLALPSPALLGSVDPSTPGIRVGSVSRSRGGVVTVTLSADSSRPSATELRDLSARLVWTLRGDPLFTGLRLADPTGVLRLQGTPEVQAATAWQSYDPENLQLPPTYYFVAGHRLRSQGAKLPTSALTQGTVPIDVVAVSPRGDRIAALRRTSRGVAVHLGSALGATFPLAVEARDLRSPTWGSGEAGLWMLQGSSVVRLDAAGSSLETVATPGRPPGRIRSLALSRDGARAALVIGNGIYVAKLIWSSGTPSLVDPRRVAAPASVPQQVVWSTPTELVVLEVADATQGGARAVQRIAVDGSASNTVPLGSLNPTTVAAAGQVIVVASGEAATTALWQVGPVGRGIAKVQLSGTAPAFPG
ncbi:MAG: hypothetical protein QOJ48_1614 [Frankiales bacterium]|nr:hypothetical protein [Frankiales bacterium]